jgi:hypothetical protein
LFTRLTGRFQLGELQRGQFNPIGDDLFFYTAERGFKLTIHGHPATLLRA